MIFVRITMNVLPEKQKELVQTLLSMIEPTGKEAGCLSYTVFCNIDDKNRFTLLEEWKNRKDLEDHIKSHRFGALLGTPSIGSSTVFTGMTEGSTFTAAWKCFRRWSAVTVVPLGLPRP